MSDKRDAIMEACRTLGTGDGSSLRDVKRSFRALSARLHPDVRREDHETCVTRFRELKKAYDLLLEHCETCPVRFSGDTDPGNPDYDHMRKFYDGWIGNGVGKRSR